MLYVILSLSFAFVANGIFILVALLSDDEFTASPVKTKARRWIRLQLFTVGAEIVISLILAALGYLLSLFIYLL